MSALVKFTTKSDGANTGLWIIIPDDAARLNGVGIGETTPFKYWGMTPIKSTTASHDPGTMAAKFVKTELTNWKEVEDGTAVIVCTPQNTAPVFGSLGYPDCGKVCQPTPIITCCPSENPCAPFV